ncbi:MAG: hypothetical protein HYZ73_06165 [Elusimicrobia bacterium]|nr:hypothetical protein [Elusimicrobiota bacterium]
MTSPLRSAHGVTLPEFLIASVIGVILTFTITVLFRQTMRTSVSTQQTTRITNVAQQLLETLTTNVTEAQHLLSAGANSVTLIAASGDPVTYQWDNGRLLRNQQPAGDPAVQVTQFQLTYFRAETKEEVGSPTSEEGLVEEPLGVDPASELSAAQRERIRLIKVRLSLREGTHTHDLATAAAPRLAH